MKGNKRLIAGLTIILVLITMAVLAPVLSGFDPDKNDLLNRLAAPDKVHLLGTDYLGRDQWARILYGTRLSLKISFLILAVSLLFGTTVGIICGYYGGFISTLLMSLVDILLAFPSMILALAIAGLMGIGQKNTVITLCAVSWIGYARMVRNLVLSLREKEYIKASIISGTPHRKIIFIHIIPHIIHPVLTYAGTHVGSIVMQIAALSFLGLGVAPPTAEWGSMLNEAKGFITAAPWLTVAPSVMLIITVTGFNLFGEGIAEAFGTKSSQAEEEHE